MSTKVLYRLLRYTGLPYLFRTIVQRDKVTILMLHDIDLANAEKSLNYLAKRYRFISLRDYMAAQKSRNKKAIPKNAVILTFDDGHKGNYELLPLLKKLQIPATIFLCAGIIDTNRHYWFAHTYKTKLPAGIKRLKNSERLDLLEKYGYSVLQEYPERQAIKREELNAMRNLVDFQAHTVFHPCLPTCTESEELAEIRDSKRILEKEFGCSIYAMAYPNGDYSDRTIALCKKTGYECGITVDYGFNTLKSDPFRLKRLSINDTGDLNELIVKASGVWGFFKTRNGKRNGYTSVFMH